MVDDGTSGASDAREPSWEIEARAPSRQRNPVAWAALVAGVAAVAYGVIPFLFLLAWLLAPLAIILGAIAWFIARGQSERPGHTLAIVGVVLGLVAIVLGVLGVVVIDRTLTALSDRIEELLPEDDPVDDVETTVTSCERVDEGTVSAKGTIRSTAGDRPRVLTIEVETRHGDAVAGVFTTLAVGVTTDSAMEWSGTGVGIDLPGELSCHVRVFEPDPDAYNPDGINVDDDIVSDLQDSFGDIVGDLVEGIEGDGDTDGDGDPDDPASGTTTTTTTGSSG